ncbi:MAG TPA: hypothetical protein PL020_06210, partial [Candidatus Cloacimonadota bacterium]|nr:hypothetical protein [Candidatus Cloacimonadota bacterium]
MDYKFSSNPKVNRTLTQVVENLSQLAEEQLRHIDRAPRHGIPRALNAHQRQQRRNVFLIHSTLRKPACY